MSEPEFDEILTRYASRKTTDAEEKTLFHAAAENQEAFEALAHEAVLRELLDDPASRKIVLSASETQRAGRPRFLWALALAGAAAALVVAVYLERPRTGQVFKTGQPGQQTLSAMDTLPGEVAKEFESFTAIDNLPKDARIIMPSNSYRAGEAFRLAVECDVDAKLVLIEETSDGQGRILFPNRWTPTPQVTAKTVQSIPPAAEAAIELDAAAGRVRLILAAFPMTSDPDAALQRGDRLPRPIAVAEAGFEVLPK